MNWNSTWDSAMKKSAAMQSINPAVRFTMNTDSGVITWADNNTEAIPTDAEIDAEVVRLESEYVRLAYSRARIYPPIGDQLDALWKGGDDAAAMKVIVDKVKSDNPK